MNGSQSSQSCGFHDARTGRSLGGLALGLRSIISLLLASVAWASYGGSPGYVSPVGPPTLPPSSYEGGLFTRPNPIDNSGNLVVTGNVRGGKHFRGSVPYDSPASFGAPLASTRLDSFMRYSAIPQETGDYRPTPGYDAFYSPTGTVSQIRPGQTGVSAPTSPRVAGGIGQWRGEQPADVVDISDIIQPRVSAGQTNRILDTRADTWRTPGDGSLSRMPEPMSEIISGQPARQRADDQAPLQADPSMPSPEYQQQLDQFRQQLDRIKAQTSQLERSLTVREAMPPDASKEVAGDTAISAGARPAAGAIQRVPTAPDQPIADYGLQIADLGHAANPQSAIRNLQSPATPLPSRSYTQTGVNLLTADAATRAGRIAELFRTPGMPTAEVGQRNQSTPLPPQSETRNRQSAIAPVMDADEGRPGQMGSAKPAEAPAGQPPAPRAVLDAASQAKFDQYMKVAEAHHRQGRYDQAAEAYALASVYKPAEARVHLGRAYVLLASGDFPGSAVFLTKAVELDAGQGLAKVNLVDLLGGPDAFIKRITELEELVVQASEKPDLQFLLAYMYYQMDRPAEAAAAIAAAEQGLPRSRPVALLKAAITK